MSEPIERIDPLTDMAASVPRRGKAYPIVMDRTIVVIGRRWRSKWWSIHCCGCRCRRRKNGSCKHERAVLSMVKPEMRARARIDAQAAGDRNPTGQGRPGKDQPS